jgi:DNA invertase Pin-like site-specific DNA recombinase
MLSKYATEHGFGNQRLYIDDGVSGTTFNREGFQSMLADAEAGLVSIIICKDMSRFGRDYLQVGYYTEIAFPRMDIRFIAVNDGVDSESKENSDFTPFRNILNEWVAKDTSKKVRAVMKSRALAGEHLTGCVPYGYMKDPSNSKQWIIDEPAAEVVRDIFRLYIGGMNFAAIARELDAKGIDKPCVHLEKLGSIPNGRTPSGLAGAGWRPSNITDILDRMDYLGHTISMKTTSRSYKDKRIIHIPKEDWIVTENTHEAVIDRETWDMAQKLRQQGKRRPTSAGEMAPLNGFLYCSDCNAKLYITRGMNVPKHREFYNCSRYRKTYDCKLHRIIRRNIEALVLEDLQKITAFAKASEKEFVEMVSRKLGSAEAKAIKAAQKECITAERRIGEIDRIISGLYEDKIKGVLPAERFAKMLSEYEAEQRALSDRVAALHEEVTAETDKAQSADKFLTLVRKYTDMTELTHEIVAAFIDRIIVGKLERIDGVKHQTVKIIYNIIGEMDSTN